MAGLAIGASTAAAISAVIAAQTTGETSAATPVTITATVTPPAPIPPTPLPAAEANRHTCNTWLAAGKLINEAATTLAVLPAGTKILNPAVRANPEWSTAVQHAANQYRQAGEKLAAGVSPGTTTILDQTATSTAGVLQALATADSTYDAAGGNMYDILKVSANAMDVLCERLAPQ